MPSAEFSSQETRYSVASEAKGAAGRRGALLIQT